MKKFFTKTAIATAFSMIAINSMAMDDQKKDTQLEKCFLANVALYMPQSDVTKLYCVNKKCSDAIACLRRAKIQGGIETTMSGEDAKYNGIKPDLFNCNTLDLCGDITKAIEAAATMENIDQDAIVAVSIDMKDALEEVKRIGGTGGFKWPFINGGKHIHIVQEYNDKLSKIFANLNDIELYNLDANDMLAIKRAIPYYKWNIKRSSTNDNKQKAFIAKSIQLNFSWLAYNGNSFFESVNDIAPESFPEIIVHESCCRMNADIVLPKLPESRRNHIYFAPPPKCDPATFTIPTDLSQIHYYPDLYEIDIRSYAELILHSAIENNELSYDKCRDKSSWFNDLNTTFGLTYRAQNDIFFAFDLKPKQPYICSKLSASFFDHYLFKSIESIKVNELPTDLKKESELVSILKFSHKLNVNNSASKQTKKALKQVRFELRPINNENNEEDFTAFYIDINNYKHHTLKLHSKLAKDLNADMLHYFNGELEISGLSQDELNKILGPIFWDYQVKRPEFLDPKVKLSEDDLIYIITRQTPPKQSWYYSRGEALHRRQCRTDYFNTQTSSRQEQCRYHHRWLRPYQG